MSSDSALWGSYLSLGLQALVPIAIGSFKSLKTPESTLAKRRANRKDKLLDEEDEDDEDETIEETLTWADSLLFPIFGSVALLGLWAILKYVGKQWINLILGVYFTGAGMFAVQSTFSSIANFSLRTLGKTPTTYHIRISDGIKQVFHQPITLPSLILLPISILLPLLYIPLGRPYLLSNVLALSLSTATLALLKLDSFFTAFLLLGVLLVYDIFWVFATPVMVTVAKGIDAPIKILSPKTSPFGQPKDFAMLGLGDIVVPGLVIALCLRYDLARHAKAHPALEVTARSSFSKPYFSTGLISYVIGLGATMVVMHTFKAAQPALLYLSPACTLGPLLLAVIKGEVKDLWTWTDGPTEEQCEKKLLDETIEAASEVAMKARAEIKGGSNSNSAPAAGSHEDGDGNDVGGEAIVIEDDSWMEGGVVAPDEGKPRKRKGGKRK
ncbi:minor histocompatibility antigen H13 [Kwoniella heveanensis CBS 569]|uniref:Minor histocompatibility antigen H13 n=1 Tax=Kwoniella heveanensis BCC8398 TaxID=1296120 RepID=A0A1B9GZ54_9TREE|nr:minor histocompatibility antigen H13 [Kwoniella heveanensis BCC8398]OCF44119.1 minor histocompatibility antigen H13 [Kwoniella heveanensis CBS 569]